ncbi:MAG: pilus assembly PilX family protein [Janthinobacterium lividum]
MLKPAAHTTAGLRAMHAARHQRGVVMIIALIVLVAMTLGGIALVRSVYTSNLIAGNLAFRESAISSGDAGVEAAVAWLQAPVSCPDLGADCPDSGYSAARSEPAPGQSWDDFWLVLEAAGKTRKLPAADAANNNVAYAIQRLCNALGAVQSASCSSAPAGAAGSGNSNANINPLNSLSRVYYRVTSRISGPRNTVTYTQVIIAM